MLFWTFALLLVAILGLVGFYQGALRAGISFVGLLAAALLAKPLAVVLDFILPALGLTHPAILAFVSPVLGFILVLTAFKVVAFIVHKKVDTWYKYKSSDTERLLWERLNSRMGISIGIVNGCIYVFLLTTLTYSIGYFTAQMATPDNESWIINSVNRLSRDIQATGMVKSISPFNPATETYYDACDVLADLFHSPLLQNRLANYPLFLSVGERPEFKAIADPKFQEQWASGISFRDFSGHETVRALTQNVDIYTNIFALVKPDLKDLKVYLETGASPKYDEEKILGRWDFNFRASVAEARKRKPTIGTAELRRLRGVLGTFFANSTLVATVDNKAILKLPQNRTAQGSWSSAGGGQYILNISEGDKKFDLQVYIDGKRMTFIREGLALVFDNSRV